MMQRPLPADVLRQTTETYRQACGVADRVLDRDISDERRAELLAEHDALRCRHASLGALYAKLTQPDVTEH